MQYVKVVMNSSEGGGVENRWSGVHHATKAGDRSRGAGDVKWTRDE